MPSPLSVAATSARKRAVFSQPDKAEQSGFPPCQRCYPNRILPDEPHLDLIRQVCGAIAEGFAPPPTLAQLTTPST
nr:hypothetical protein [Pleurocapsa sp. PCC 7327]